MKILFVFNHPAPYKIEYFNQLSQEVDLTVIIERIKASNRNKAFYQDNEYNFKLVKIKGLNIGQENHLSWGIKKHLEKNHYDLVIMNGYSTFSEMIAICYLIKHQMPYQLYINGGIIPQKENKIKYRLKKYFISHAKHYFAPTIRSKEYLIHYGAIEKNIYLYPYSSMKKGDMIDRTLSDKEIIDIKEKYQIPLNKHVLISVGELNKRKNFEILLDVMEELDNDYVLIIIGEGKNKHKLEKIIKYKSLNNVLLRGYLPKSEVLNYIKASDIFLFPTKYDIYGHVVIEALMNGVIVIASERSNASKEIIKDGYNGYLITTNSKEEYLQKIKLGIQSISRENARNSVKEYIIENTVLENIKQFKDILKK